MLLIGDALAQLQTIPRDSIHCCVTSPPYFGLRDYGKKGQIGLEKTPEEYVQKLVAVFQEVRRVLHPSGTLWLNLGDSYASQGFTGGLKAKDLVGIPWMVAFALRADGWYLRSDIIWAKGNCMPESVTDRPTRSHESIFLLAKSPRYFYDQDAIREPHNLDYVQRRLSFQSSKGKDYRGDRDPAMCLRYDGVPVGNPAGRNKRSVWHINPTPYAEAHFATFPPALPEICIRAGTSERGCCPTCKAPWDRVTEIESQFKDRPGHPARYGDTASKSAKGFSMPRIPPPSVTQLGWQPTCSCPEHTPEPCVVLDPFAGSGTTLMVATELRRQYVGIELNPEYAKLIEQRLENPLVEEAQRRAFDDAMAYAETLGD